MTTDPLAPSSEAATAATNGHDRCLLCGYSNPWSLGLSFHAGDNGCVITEFRGHAGLQGYEGMLHGGVIAALLDSAMTHCLFHCGIRGVTGDLHVRFVEPVPCDSALVIQAQIAYAKPPLFRLRSELFKDGQVMAWAEAKFIAPSVPRTPMP